MKLIAFEIKKLFSSLFRVIILSLLLIACIGSAVLYSADQNINGIPTDIKQSFVEHYNNNPDEVMQRYNERETAKKEYEEAIFHMTPEEIKNYPPLVLTDYYSDSDEYSDDDLYEMLFSMIDYRDSFKNDIGSLLSDAYGRYTSYRELGMKNIALIELQKQYLNHYGAVYDNVTLDLQVVSGWDILFQNRFADVILGLIVIFLISPIFASEKSYGFYPIIQTCKNGRSKTVLAKLSAAALFAVSVTLITSALSFGIVGIMSGFSSASAPVQMLEGMKYCPYTFSMLEFWFFSVALKLFANLVLTAVVCALSSLFNKPVYALSVSLIIWTVNASCMLLPYESFLSQCNLFSIAGAATFAMTYRAYIISFLCIGQLPFCLITWGIAAVICFVTPYLLWRKPARFRQKAHGRTNEAKAKTSNSGGTLLVYELRKILTSRFVLAMLALFIIAESGVFFIKLTREHNESEEYYREYTKEYAGELTEERALAIYEENSRIKEITEQFEIKLEQIRNNEITEEEWQEYILIYTDAYNHMEASDRMIEKLSALDDLPENQNPWIVYDTEWRNTFLQNPDYFLILLIICISCLSFAPEYQIRKGGSFAPILRSTVFGRSKTYFAKLVACLTISFVLSLCTTALDIALLLLRDGFILPNAPLGSLTMFATTTDISIGNYLLLSLIIKICAMLLLSIITALLSCICRKEIITTAIVGSAVFLPYMLTSLGVKQFRFIDFIRFSTTSLWLEKGFELNSVLVVFAALLAGAALLISVSYRKFCK